MKYKNFFVIVMIILFSSPFSFSQESVIIDHIDGLDSLGYLKTGDTITFYLKYTFNIENIKSIKFDNGYKIYSEDGAIWAPITVSELLNSELHAPKTHFTHFSVNGSGADSIGLRTQFTYPYIKEYFTNGYSSIIHSFTTIISEDQHGKTICIDSASFPPKEGWNWSYHPQNNNLAPAWGGPYCYSINSSCCLGKRGNSDGSELDPLDISDLTYIIFYLYFDFDDPNCLEEADVNGDNVINLSDIMLISDYMFGVIPTELLDCPN